VTQSILRRDIINLHLLNSKLPKKIKDILETSDETFESGFSLKQGKFEITLKELDSGGNFKMKDIIELNKI